MRLVGNPSQQGDEDWQVTLSERRHSETRLVDLRVFPSRGEAALYYVKQILSGAYFYCPKCNHSGNGGSTHAFHTHGGHPVNTKLR